MLAVFGLCVLGGVAIYFLAIRRWFLPLEDRIPNGKEYRATVGPSKGKGSVRKHKPGYSNIYR